ncbi:MAG TPA: hypothetical protein VHV83_04130, partial [Armatimonadota bacterium]|nr:hypothetical protein [Armatimonadota bacterium]
PRGPVLVAWAEKDTTLTVPTDKAAITMANIFGDTHTVSANHGTVSVNVGPEAEYLIGIGTLFTKQLNTPAPPVKAAKAATPAPIIVVGHDDRSLPINRQRDGYLLSKITADGTLAPFTYQVDVYNFSKTSVRGTIKLALPSGWKASTMSNSVTIPAMGRVTCPVTITPQAGMQYAALTVTGSFGDMHVAPSTSYFMVDAVPMLLHAAKHQSLAWADAARWKQNNAVIAPTTVTNRDPETLQLSTTFTQQGDRWVYPTINFTPPMDMSAYDYALTFDYQCDVDSPTSGLHMMFVEPNGATYMSSNNLPVTTKAQHGIVYFHDLNWLNLSAKDDNGHLDLNRIAAVRFGGNFAAKDLNHVTITVKNFQLLATPADLPIIAEAEKGTYSTGWGVTNNAGYSGSKYLNLWENTDPDEKGYWADVPFTVPVTGRYDLYFSGNTLSRLASPCSISPFSWTVDNGKVQQADVPRVMKDVPGCYMLAEIPCLLDTVPLTAGPHVFHLRITTRRMTGDHYYALWFDAIMLQRVDSTAKTK